MDTTQADLKVIFEFLKNHILSNGIKVIKVISPVFTDVGGLEITEYIFKNIVFRDQDKFSFACISSRYHNFHIMLKNGQYVCRNEENLIRCVSDLIKERMKKWND